VNLPSWYPGTESKPAPMPLLLVQGFINTHQLDDQIELLDDPEAGRRWLEEAGLLGEHVALTAEDLVWARAIRESIRGLLELAEGQARGNDLEPLRELAERHHPRLRIHPDGALSLENPGHGTLDDGLFELLLIIRQAQEEGTWSRLKLCGNPDCRWAYYDRSRNQQGHWCDMASCGNRLNNRQLRARRR